VMPRLLWPSWRSLTKARTLASGRPAYKEPPNRDSSFL
jgi:hypothetical protein